jgi:hypothetical protein
MPAEPQCSSGKWRYGITSVTVYHQNPYNDLVLAFLGACMAFCNSRIPGVGRLGTARGVGSKRFRTYRERQEPDAVP